ncbi:ribosomal L1 domain-containing protein 1-like [Liolophura sinensis]|uniref:ribosomal L1 domain-containing protein 1-like n=1 Tax=Liolophura sinensis TaxID=3198878 RepID=UPI00315885A4
MEPMDIDKQQVEKAVSALQLLIKKTKPDTDFLDNPEKILLQFTFKKVPQLKNKTIKLNLPNGVATDSQFVSLFVKDLDRKSREHEDTVFHYKELLSRHNIQEISEIIPLKALKTMYKPYEAKRNLSNSFNLHLTDERIAHLLPSLLGKHFYGRKRHPVQVNLTVKDLKKEINRALNNSRCVISGRGSSCTAYVAHSKQTVVQITENVMSAAQQIAQSIPGGAANIRSFHIKTEKSVSLPVYASLDSAKDVKLPKVEKKREMIEPEEVTTVMKGKVRVFPTGEVHIVTEESEMKRKRKLEKIGQTTRLKVKRRKPDGPKVKATASRKGQKASLTVLQKSGETLKKQKKVAQTKSKTLTSKTAKTGKTKDKA